MLLHINRLARQLSEAFLGCHFEPYRDNVLVTGGVQGLGRELVKLFAAKGAKVAVLDVKEPLPADRVDSVFYFQCDVSDRVQVQNAYNEVKETVGVVSVLVNNAGITTDKELVQLSYEEIERVIGVNLTSSFYTIKTFLPDMLTLKRGYIVTIASVLGYMSPARLSAYGASKSGLIALHESLTYELGPPSLNPTGVKTLLVCPGQLKTGMFASVETPASLLAPELEPELVAKCVLNALELGKRGEIRLPLYGSIIPIFRAFPWPIVEIVRRYSGIDKSLDTFKMAAEKVANFTARSQTSASAISHLSSSLVSLVARPQPESAPP